ncbi:endolytic transglycosylase MltG [Desulfurobacterium atlanticum]|uniref:Endolytic murein transglycosylase n=1 Tax=Desulfurobacterium atlanticum TaxID=240169 RepID=A0A238YR24_9BACT|nr:endolytic transglycosylase MltG [Desulfurobacterium atlanticum]SNR72889.1 UPF0755 protein [Desulfurobacterium atlanticum]
MKKLTVSILFVFLAFLIVDLSSFYKKRNINLEFEVKEGETVGFVIKKLKEEGGFSGSIFTDIVVRFEDIKFKAGKYRINGAYSDKDVIDILRKGQLTLVKITIPEGYSVFDIANVVEEKGFCSEDRFLKLAFNKTFVETFGIKSESLEGFLFPDTYYFAERESCEAVIKVMYRNFEKRVIPLFKNYSPPKIVKKALGNVTIEKIVNVASIVERETALKEERPKIAGIIYRRLIKGMPLQCDPTVIYGYRMEGKKLDTLKGSDIRKSRSVYNTYIYKGLPPTPICNPGIDSIVAAMFPEKTDYLYFFAVNGRHIFSKTYREHLNKMKKYYNKAGR